MWKETPFVALLVSGAMAALDRASIEAARNLGAGSLRILIEILLPQIAGVMTVALVLAFVTMLSVLSVPIMISGGSPTMITVDMAFRVNSYSDYGVANALGFISYLIAGLAAWIYVRTIRRPGGGMTLALGWLWRASVLGLFAFAVFGPLANLLLWAFAIQWY